ncbi:hypothetical protein BDK92_2066 [Micromonospora pisi]|uniref:Uncharacterized protein n=1 Tax=Micromonospora pisi TaxID=589240 RepID=A0A495JHA4_9ACTN|nr:hypothetical protein [Micromonospora pisi]RKR87774.1 hypothetical protein BDK92_2066 [Micromonospora pisi]
MSDANLFDRPSAADSAPVDVTPEPFDITPGFGLEDDPDGNRSGPMSRRRLIVLGAALLVGVAGAAVLGSFGWRIAQQKDTTLAIPAQVAGLTLDESARARGTVDDLLTGLAADIQLDASAGAVYTDPVRANRPVLFFGGTTLIWQPERDLDRLFKLVADDSGEIAGLRGQPAGDLGGVLKCGTSGQGDTLTVCGWADHGSVGMAMFPGREVDEAAPLMLSIRNGVQTRN